MAVDRAGQDVHALDVERLSGRRHGGFFADGEILPSLMASRRRSRCSGETIFAAAK